LLQLNIFWVTVPSCLDLEDERVDFELTYKKRSIVEIRFSFAKSTCSISVKHSGVILGRTSLRLVVLHINEEK